MDETTFQRELSLLKYRVAQMTSTFQTRSPYVFHVPAVCNDAYFSDQLLDVKARLQAMQASIDTLHATTRNCQEPQDRMSEYEPPQHNRLALPSGPLFWQLFTSLRTDVHGLNGRVGDLEHNVSDLEDRVDKIDPSFTPPGSADTFSSFGWSQQVRDQPNPAGEAKAFAGEASLPAFVYPYSDHASQGRYHSRDSLWGNIELPASTGDQADLSARPQQPAPEGVAFRDREIAQLEELMRGAHDSLRGKEDVIGQKDAEISTLRARIKELDRVAFERTNQVQCYGGILAERQREVERLQEDCHAKDCHLNTWEMKFHDMQQSLSRKKMQLSQARQELQQVKREDVELRDFEATLAQKDREVKELRDFCEAKESVAQQQEQIISRGATLIEEKDRQINMLDDDYRTECRERARLGRLLHERDDEIEQLKQSLHHALMPNAKAKVQDEKPALPARPSQILPEAHVHNGLLSYSPFATAGTRSATRGEDWTPKAFKNYAMLPHESLRASAWNKGRSCSDHYKFGVPGVATPPPSNTHIAKRDERRDLRRSDSVKLLRRLALAEEGGSRATRPGAESGNVANRTRLPLDDAIVSPPLPAPLPPRKVTSLEDLSRISRHERDADPQHMPKSHSLDELSDRPLLQAYVEDGENSGDRHGDE